MNDRQVDVGGVPIPEVKKRIVGEIIVHQRVREHWEAGTLRAASSSSSDPFVLPNTPVPCRTR